MAAEVGSAPGIPQLQSVQKAMALPAVGAAVGQVGAFYTRVKGAHSLLEWALSTAEASVTRAAATAAPYVAAQLAAGDARVAAALAELERRVPMVAEQPKVIVETTKQAVLSRITPQLNKVYGARDVAEQRVKSLKELTWAKANVLLTSAYGQKALHGVDSGAGYAMQLLDRYLPPAAGEPAAGGAALAPLHSEPALHAVQTVGRLSAVAARRVWANLAARLQQLQTSGIELDVRRYVTALLAALHLARVTSQQQPEGGELPQKCADPTTNGHHAEAPHSAPTTNGHHAETHYTAPTTTQKVKSTPEAKSDGGDSH